MAYEKTVWETGDVITAEKLNNMEVGIETAGNVKVIPLGGEGYDTSTLTWNEIKTLAEEKYIMCFYVNSDFLGVLYFLIIGIGTDNGKFAVNALTDTGASVFETDNEDGYPVLVVT